MLQLRHLRPVPGPPRRYINAHRHGRHPVHTLARHLIHQRLGQPVAVLDGVHACAQRRRYSIAANRMRRHQLAQTVRLLNNRPRLFIREIDHAMEHAIRCEMIFPVGVVLNPVRPIHHLLAHRFPRTLHTIHVLHARGHLQLPRIPQQRIHPRGRHRPRGHLHARPRHFTPGNGHLHVHVGVHRPFRLQIPHGREPMLQPNPSVPRTQNRAIWYRLLEELLVVIRRRHIPVQQQVRMRIDKSRQHRRLRQINHLNARGRRAARRHRDDLVALNQNQRVLRNRIALPIDQPPSPNSGSLSRRLFLLLRPRPVAQPQRRQDRESKTHRTPYPQSNHHGICPPRERLSHGVRRLDAAFAIPIQATKLPPRNKPVDPAQPPDAEMLPKKKNRPFSGRSVLHCTVPAVPSQILKEGDFARYRAPATAWGLRKTYKATKSSVLWPIRDAATADAPNLPARPLLAAQASSPGERSRLTPPRQPPSSSATSTAQRSTRQWPQTPRRTAQTPPAAPARNTAASPLQSPKTTTSIYGLCLCFP